MTKLSTTPPKQLMNPPMWKMDQPIPPPVGISGKLRYLVYWTVHLFSKAPKPISHSGETIMWCGVEIKSTNGIMDELDLELEPFSQNTPEEDMKLIDSFYCIMKTDGSTIGGFHKYDD